MEYKDDRKFIEAYVCQKLSRSEKAIAKIKRCSFLPHKADMMLTEWRGNIPVRVLKQTSLTCCLRHFRCWSIAGSDSFFRSLLTNLHTNVHTLTLTFLFHFTTAAVAVSIRPNSTGTSSS